MKRSEHAMTSYKMGIFAGLVLEKIEVLSGPTSGNMERFVSAHEIEQVHLLAHEVHDLAQRLENQAVEEDA